MHPTRTVVGGFTVLPKKEELSSICDKLKESLKDLAVVAELFSGFSIPDFERETEFVSLKGEVVAKGNSVAESIFCCASSGRRKLRLNDLISS